MKRFLSLLFALTILLSVMIPAFADGSEYWYTYEGCSFLYVINDDQTITITSAVNPPRNVTIPSEIDGLPVTTIGQAFMKCYDLRTVTIPDTVTVIDDYAFWCCEKLHDLVLPDSLTSIGIFAFYYCESLTTITIPDTVTFIGQSAFFGCGKLKEVILTDSERTVEHDAFDDCSSSFRFTVIPAPFPETEGETLPTT